MPLEFTTLWKNMNARECVTCTAAVDSKETERKNDGQKKNNNNLKFSRIETVWLPQQLIEVERNVCTSCASNSLFYSFPSIRNCCWLVVVVVLSLLLLAFINVLICRCAIRRSPYVFDENLLFAFARFSGSVFFSCFCRAASISSYVVSPITVLPKPIYKNLLFLVGHVPIYFSISATNTKYLLLQPPATWIPNYTALLYRVTCIPQNRINVFSYLRFQDCNNRIE